MKLLQLIGLTTATVLITVSVASCQEIQIGDLIIQNPTIRATPPKAPVSGGYMTIKNTGKTPDRLSGGTVSFAKKVEVHQMKMENSIMKMRHLPNGLQIPAGGEVILKPGGYHVMFKKLRQ